MGSMYAKFAKPTRVDGRPGWFNNALSTIRSTKRLGKAFDPLTDNLLNIAQPTRSNSSKSTARNYWRIGRKNKDDQQTAHMNAVIAKCLARVSCTTPSPFAASMSVDIDEQAASFTTQAKQRALVQYISSKYASEETTPESELAGRSEQSQIALRLLKFDSAAARKRQTTELLCQLEASNAIELCVQTTAAANDRVHRIMSGAEEILFDLARDEDIGVRISVAANTNTPECAMWILVEDRCNQVRMRLAENEAAPLEILEILSRDKDELVARRASSAIRKLWDNTNNGTVCGAITPIRVQNIFEAEDVA